MLGKGGQEARCFVALVSGRQAHRAVEPHGQERLGTVKRLNLRLLVHAEHQSALRWIQVHAQYSRLFLLNPRVRTFAAPIRGFVRLGDPFGQDFLAC